ncbi:O-antigen ligase [Maribacter sedimenticola]|uniref:O-antigen ligase n=1 Tax=Maribacter sedimenticola TaxID=228956 RepID=A0ABY1SJX1_9FLAO|nr:O-antigen ligase family protein [Maribacter sedimenticola]SNR67013.1 O-antigen ligase [Maribacter sedimenticola]
MVQVFKNLNRLFLYVLIFAACFEYWDPFYIAKDFSLARIATIPYILSVLPFLKQFLNFKNLLYFISPLLFLIISGIFSSVFNDIYVVGIADVLNFRIFQLVLLMILLTANMILFPHLLKGVLNVYILAMFTMAFLFTLFGVGVEYIDKRLFLFGENANQTAMKTALALLLLISILIKKKLNFKNIIQFLILSLPILNLLISTNSRGGLLTFFIGIFLILLLIKTNWLSKIGLFLLGLGFSTYLFIYIMDNDKDFKARIETTVNKGDTAGRTHLWDSAYRIIEDNMMFGVGNSGLLPSMKIYSGIYTEPHNVLLEVWLIYGFIGFIAFLLFLFRIIKQLLIVYKIKGEFIQLVLFFVVLLNMLKSGGAMTLIFAWIFFAIFISSIYYENNPNLDLNVKN